MRIFNFVIFGVVLGGLSSLVPLFVKSQSEKSAIESEFIDIGVPVFRLTNAVNGSAFSEEKLSGKVTVLNFFFSSCHGPCPITMLHMSYLSKLLIHNKHVQFVSISVDPNNDSAEILTDYAKKINLDSRNWSLLTGDKEEIAGLITKLKLAVEGDDIANLHTTRFLLIDRKGHLKGFFDGTNREEVDKLVNAIDLV